MTRWTDALEAAIATDACSTTWPLLDPNAEDRAAGRTHHCTRTADHLDAHRCACGDTIPNVGERGDP